MIKVNEKNNCVNVTVTEIKFRSNCTFKIALFIMHLINEKMKRRLII